MVSFTVIVPTLHSSFIDQTLDSLRTQRYDLSRVEVVVVGQDRRGLVREDGLVRFLSSPVPLSPAAARNRGMAQAAGDVVAFLDADCLASPTWLDRLAERYEDPNVSVVGGGVAFPHDNYWTVCDNLSWFHEVLATAPAGKRPYLPTLNLSLRRDVVERVGGLDERFPQPAGEDTEWTLRMRLAGYVLHFEPRATVYHCHARTTLRQVLEHAFHFGRHSVRVNPQYAEALHSPSFMRHPWCLLLLAPLLAGGATARILARAPQYGHTLPVVYLTKLSWCLGAAAGRRSAHTPQQERFGVRA